MSTLKQKQKIIRNTKGGKKKFKEIKCVRSTIKYGKDLLYKAKKFKKKIDLHALVEKVSNM